MKILSGITAAAVLTAALMFGSTTTYSQDVCEGGKKHTIQVRPSADGQPELKYKGGSAEDVHVCLGDTVQWVLNGPDRDFLVEFFDISAFDGDKKGRSKRNKLSVEIVGSFERGNAYAYGVEFEGGEPMDPRIIVE